MTTGWIGDGGSSQAGGGLVVNAITAGMGNTLRLVRGKLHAWGSSGHNPTTDTGGGSGTSDGTESRGLKSAEFNEAVATQIVNVECDAKLMKADVLSEAYCLTPLSGRKYVDDGTGITTDVNYAIYEWVAEFWRDNSLLGDITFRYPKPGKQPPPIANQAKEKDAPIYYKSSAGLGNSTKYWYQSLTDAGKYTEIETVPDIFYRNSGVGSESIDSVTYYVGDNNPADVATVEPSAVEVYWAKGIRKNDDGSETTVTPWENITNIPSVIGKTASFSYDANAYSDISGSLSAGSTVEVIIGFTVHGKTGYVQQSFTVSSSGGVRFSPIISYIDIQHPTVAGVSLSLGSTNGFSVNEDEIYVKTSSGGWEKRTTTIGGSIDVIVESAGNATAPTVNINPTFPITGIVGYGLSANITHVYYVGGSWNGKGARPTNMGTKVSDSMSRLVVYNVGAIPQGYKLMFAHYSGSTLLKKGQVPVGAQGEVLPWYHLNQAVAVPNGSNTTVGAPPLVKAPEITVGSGFPTELILRKGDYVTLRTPNVYVRDNLTPPTVAGDDNIAGPDLTTMSRLYEFGCNIHIPIEVA